MKHNRNDKVECFYSLEDATPGSPTSLQVQYATPTVFNHVVAEVLVIIPVGGSSVHVSMR